MMTENEGKIRCSTYFEDNKVRDGKQLPKL